MMIWSLFTSIVLIVFPAPLMRIFVSEGNVIEIGVSYLRVMGFSQILMCLSLIHI